jgi:hypothetical protein
MRSIILYDSHFEIMQSLSNENAGQLIKAIAELQLDGDVNPTIEDPIVSGIFMVIKHDIIRQIKNYDKVCKINAENGKKGGRPKKDNISEESESVISIATTTEAKRLKHKDRDRDKDKARDKDKSKGNNKVDIGKYTNQYSPEEIDNLFNN